MLELLGSEYDTKLFYVKCGVAILDFIQVSARIMDRVLTPFFSSCESSAPKVMTDALVYTMKGIEQSEYMRTGAVARASFKLSNAF